MKSDFEYIFIVIVMLLLFVFSLTRKTKNACGGGKTLFVIDLQMSYVIKGLACLLILLGHYANMRISPNFSVISIVWMFSSNVALTWFMFFSGYGLSKNKTKLECCNIISNNNYTGKLDSACFIYISCCRLVPFFCDK